jgi:hypothetical protein
MDADNLTKKLAAQENAAEDKSRNGKAKQADLQSDTEPFDKPKDGAREQKVDAEETERKIETLGTAGVAAAAAIAIFQTIPH